VASVKAAAGGRRTPRETSHPEGNGLCMLVMDMEENGVRERGETRGSREREEDQRT